MERNKMNIDEERKEKMKTFRGQLQVLREEGHVFYGSIIKPIFKFLFKTGIVMGAIGFTLYVRQKNLTRDNGTDGGILANIEKERILNTSQRNS